MCQIQLRMWKHTPSICASKFPSGQFLKKKNNRVHAYCPWIFIGWQHLQYAYPENHTQNLLFPNMWGTHGFIPSDTNQRTPIQNGLWGDAPEIFWSFFPQFWRDFNQAHQLHLTCWSKTVNMSVGDDIILATKIIWMVKEPPLVTVITSASLVLVLHFCLLYQPLSAILDYTI